MLKIRLCLSLSALLLVSNTPISHAQTLPQSLPQSLPQTLPQTLPQSGSQQPVDNYIPLFSPEQIANASETQRKRMESTEKLNRSSWMKRRQDAAEAKAKLEASAPPPKPAKPKYTRKGKIYKWVDAQGRVHFGDSPPGKGSEQIKLRNTAPAKGAPPPPPAPHLKKGGDDV
jgi:hypothetical protein